MGSTGRLNRYPFERDGLLARMSYRLILKATGLQDLTVALFHLESQKQIDEAVLQCRIATTPQEPLNSEITLKDDLQLSNR